MSNTLASAIYVHEPLKWDFPLYEYIENNLKFCDFVYIVLTPPDDETIPLIEKMAKDNPRIRTISVPWNVYADYKRHFAFKDACVCALQHDKIDWACFIDCDEILHERYFPIVRQLMEKNDNRFYYIRRYNLWGDFKHMLKQNITQFQYAGCRLWPVRMMQPGRVTGNQYYYDTNDDSANSDTQTEKIHMFHYTYMRKPDVMLDKAINMQMWKGGVPDGRVLAMKQNIGTWKPMEWCADGKHKMQVSDLDVIPESHPAVMQKWISDRQQFYPDITIGGLS